MTTIDKEWQAFQQEFDPQDQTGRNPWNQFPDVDFVENAISGRRLDPGKPRRLMGEPVSKLVH
jgi:hypothetical protein